MSDPDILLLSCYELGHQPLSLAWPLAVLRKSGYAPAGVDLSVQPFPERLARGARLVAIAVPMHTAMHLGVQAARLVRRHNPQAHITFYGLYAWLNRHYLLENRIADSILAGEYEKPLLSLAQTLTTGQPPPPIAGLVTRGHPAPPHLKRVRLPVPERQGLPPLARYARYRHGGHTHLAGYSETTRGCLHTCRHCPVVPVYRGRFFAVPLETVLADVRQQVAQGARHITFGDPDFLNGPTHALRVARGLHAEFPHLTFDFTAKVEHLLRYRHLLPELRECGATFVVSAFESLSDAVLTRLRKGHRAAQLDEVLHVLSRAGLHVQPTWLPFTPWSRLQDYLELLGWIRERGLIAHTPAVQLSIRLLVPPGSALLDDPETAAFFGPLAPQSFTHPWQHPDPRMDALQKQVAQIVERSRGDDPYALFSRIETAAHRAAGNTPPRAVTSARGAAPPRLTEDWFC